MSRAATVVALIFGAIVCVLYGCSAPSGDTGGTYVAISPSGWAYGDTVAFDGVQADSASAGRLAVMVRHTSSYPYANLWLEITVPCADGDSTVYLVDTVNVALADVYGRWLGRGSGVSRFMVDTLHRHYARIDTSITLRHIMRVDTLPGLEQLGVIFIEN